MKKTNQLDKIMGNPLEQVDKLIEKAKELKTMKAKKIHTIIKDIVSMKLASTIVVSRVFENDTLQNVVDELNWYMETQKIPVKIAKVGSAKVAYLNLDNERLDRVLYLLSWLVKDTTK